MTHPFDPTRLADADRALLRWEAEALRLAQELEEAEREVQRLQTEILKHRTQDPAPLRRTTAQSASS